MKGYPDSNTSSDRAAWEAGEWESPLKSRVIWDWNEVAAHSKDTLEEVIGGKYLWCCTKGRPPFPAYYEEGIFTEGNELAEVEAFYYPPIKEPIKPEWIK